MHTGENYISLLRITMTRSGQLSAEIEKCCQYASNLLSRDLPVFFDARHVAAALKLQPSSLNMYHTFPLNQVGKIRRITAPSMELKQRQQWILHEILDKIPISPHAHGFFTGRSIRTNAFVHADHDYALCIDLQDFFPSISSASVLEVFRQMGYSPSASRKLTDMCCYKDCLPQGAPTSPALSNIIFRPIDRLLSRIAERSNVRYSRYADDLTFSADYDMRHLFPEIERTLREYGFRINPKKIHFYKAGQPKRITGLTVQSGRVRVPKQFKRTLRQEIHYCRKYGVLNHLENIQAEHCIHYREHLYGKAYYIHMIEPEVGSKFLRALDEIQWP